MSSVSLPSTDGILVLPVGTRFMGANWPWNQGGHIEPKASARA
jgi:hypothetical protein